MRKKKRRVIPITLLWKEVYPRAFIRVLACTHLLFLRYHKKTHREWGDHVRVLPPHPTQPLSLSTPLIYSFFLSSHLSPKTFLICLSPTSYSPSCFSATSFFSASVCCSVQPAFHFLFRSLASPFFLCSSSFRHSPLLFPFGKKMNKSKQVWNIWHVFLLQNTNQKFTQVCSGKYVN